jgi:hypothetical protein
MSDETAKDPGCGCGCNLGDYPLPEANFTTFVLSLSSSAMVHLGEVPDPGTGQVSASLPLAKHTIDVLAMMEEKTRGNLSAQEKKLLCDLLCQLRMRYVAKAK